LAPAASAAHAQQLSEDNRQALVLFSIVIIFLVCNVPRVLLNFHEVSAGLPYFSWYNVPRRVKYTKWP
jgi:hypothetical protein